jgi:tetratricopeptide (TPR) repeat protein
MDRVGERHGPQQSRSHPGRARCHPGRRVGAYNFYKWLRGQHTDARVDHANRKLDAHGETLDEIRALVRQLASGAAAPAFPDRAEAIAEAVEAAQEGAAAGDARLQRALDLLKANKVAEAEALFQAVAGETAARITLDRKNAAAAYRHLGAIAGLRDPGKALEAYEQALEYDPDDLESLHSAGYLLIERGRLNDARVRLTRVLSRAAGSETFYRFWALTGLGDIRVEQGNLPDALKSFRDGLSVREGLAQSDPSNAGWQVDLVVSYWKLATNGDDAPRRWLFIVAALRKLKEEGRLTPVQEKWLPMAEAQLEK